MHCRNAEILHPLVRICNLSGIVMQQNCPLIKVCPRGKKAHN